MPPIRITTYDYNLDPYSNLKNNFLADRLAKNRWGNKFKKLYKKHVLLQPPFVGTYSFVEGMKASVDTIDGLESALENATTFRAALKENLKVAKNGEWDIKHALEHSYFAVLLAPTGGAALPVPRGAAKGLRFALCVDGAGRKNAWWHESGVKESRVCTLDSLTNNPTEYKLSLHTDTGNFGHIEGALAPATFQDNALEKYTIENKGDVRFLPDTDARIERLWARMIVYVQEMIEDYAPDYTDAPVSIIVGLGQMLSYLEDKIREIEIQIPLAQTASGRVKDDLEIIDHLGIRETLSEQIKQPHKIKNIWFKLQKEINLPHIPPDFDVKFDHSYQWWEEAQFKGKTVEGKKTTNIYENVKNFQNYCDFYVHEGIVYVRPKQEIWDLPGWKIYWFVNAFLDIEAKAKSKTLLRKIIDFVLLIVVIYLIIVSGNPMWLKILLIGTQVLGYFGLAPPELRLAMAVVSLAYGGFSADFSTMSAMQVFNFAVSNMEQIFGMLETYESIGAKKQLEKESKRENETKSLAQAQDEVMEFIYSTAYDQYDDMYEVMYDYDRLYFRES